MQDTPEVAQAKAAHFAAHDAARARLFTPVVAAPVAVPLVADAAVAPTLAIDTTGSSLVETVATPVVETVSAPVVEAYVAPPFESVLTTTTLAVILLSLTPITLLPLTATTMALLSDSTLRILQPTWLPLLRPSSPRLCLPAPLTTRRRRSSQALSLDPLLISQQ